MDYNHLRFTDADKERLKENRDVINAWIMENIVQFLSEDETIYIDYGDSYQAPGSWRRTTDYHFAVYGHDHKFHSMGRETHGHVGIGEKYGGVSDAMQTVGSPYDLFPIIDNWGYIKSRLLNEVESRKKSRMEIYNFSV